MAAADHPSEREAERVAARVTSPAGRTAGAKLAHEPRTAPAIVHAALGSAGQPLDPAIRGDLEPRFGVDFSRVMVHTGGLAARSAAAIDAAAYTVGRNIVFGAGQFAPATPAGRHLLAHELTHVAQQGAAPPVPSGAGQAIAQRTASPTLQRTKLCSRPLDGVLGKLRINHAFVDDTGLDTCQGAGMAGNYALEPREGDKISGCGIKSATAPDPVGAVPKVKPCNAKPGVTDLSKCLRDAYDRYPDPSVYSNMPFDIGPNSNTFVATLAKACCADSSDAGLGTVPGWNHAPAGPCVLSGPAPAPGVFPPSPPPPGDAPR